MTNPFARLAQQADVNVADFSRRTIESITLPLKLKSREVIDDVTRTVTASLRGLAIKAALAVFAAVMAVIALAYALSALHATLARSFDPVTATLIMAGVFAVLAIVAVVAILVWPKPAPSLAKAQVAVRHDAARVAAATRAQADAAASRVAEATRKAADEPPPDIKNSLGAIAAALGEAGFRREQAGLQAGLALAEQLRPMQLVSLALLGGFVTGLRMTRRR